MPPFQRERARQRVASLVARLDRENKGRYVAMLSSRTNPPVAPSAASRVVVWRINAQQDAQMNAGQAHLPEWAIVSTARQGVLACDPGDIVLLHASGRRRSSQGIYAAYVATYRAVMCALPSEHVQNYCQRYRPLRSGTQWRIGVRFLARVHVDKVDCASIAHHVTPHSYASVASSSLAIRNALAPHL